MPCPSGDRGRRAILTRQKYVLLYHGGRRLSTKKGGLLVEMTMPQQCCSEVFDTFTHPTCK